VLRNRATLGAALSALLLGGILAPGAQAADGTGTYATWVDQSTSPDSFAGSFPNTSFPSVEAEAQPVAGTVTKEATIQVSTSATLTGSTPFGTRFGTSSGEQYLRLGGTTSADQIAEVVVTFATAAPAGRWGFTLGDVDAEDVTVTATRGNGAALTETQLGWQGAFNYASGQTDLPTWNQGTTTLEGNTTNTSGASGWFVPTVDVKTITLRQRDLAGIPEYQLWIATDDTEPTPTPTPEPTTEPTPEPIVYTLLIDANGGACSTAQVRGESGTWADLPGADSCTRDGFEFLGFSTEASSTEAQFAPGAPVQFTGDNRLYAIYEQIVPEPFICTPDLYQVSGTGGGVLYVYDPTRNTMDLVPAGGGPSRASGANATGFNPADDFIYGIAPNGSERHLWQFGSNGVYADLGPIVDSVTGAPVQNLNLISGDFIADDILLAIQTPNRMLAVDVAATRSDQSAQSTLVTLPRGVWSPADIAINADRTAGYGLANNTLYIATLPGGDAASQIAAIGQRDTYSRKRVQGVPSRGAYGAAYLDQDNNAYFYNNQERRIYLITAAELAKPQPRATPLGTEKAFVLGTDQTLQVPTDGASCPTAPIVTVTLTYDINGGEGETPNDQTGFVDQEVTVADGVGFERDEAVFAGWNTSPDGSGANFAPGALFDLGASGGKLYAMWKPVEPAPVVPPENVLEPITEPEPPAEEDDTVVFTPLDDLPAPPNDPWNPSSLVLIDPDGGNPTPSVSDDSGDWSVNNRIGTVTYEPNPAHSGTAEVTIQVQTDSGVRYQSTLQTTVPSCEVGERVRATVYFDVLSDELDARSQRTLNRLVRDANARGVPTCSVVVGFVQPTVRRDNDISLSTARAASVADYLESRGIERIVRTEGLGRADQQGAKARRATATIYVAPPPAATPVDQ